MNSKFSVQLHDSHNCILTVAEMDGMIGQMIEMYKVLAKRINVKIEETQGLDMCAISVHNLPHVHEDVLNFSATDNYWCAVFERAVKDYVKRSNNCKGVEGTFAKAEARKEYLKSGVAKTRVAGKGKG